jgi:hypothetical protein
MVNVVAREKKKKKYFSSSFLLRPFPCHSPFTQLTKKQE